METDYKTGIEKIDNWPKDGIVCYDVAPLLRDGNLFRQAIDELAVPYASEKIDAVIGIEARGFVVASALAYKLGCGVALIRKKGKTTPPAISQEYSFEYAAQVIEIKKDVFNSNSRVVLVDDTLATGGTMAAALKLIKQTGARVIGISFMVEIKSMAGRLRLPGQSVHSLVRYD